MNIFLEFGSAVTVHKVNLSGPGPAAGGRWADTTACIGHGCWQREAQEGTTRAESPLGDLWGSSVETWALLFHQQHFQIFDLHGYHLFWELQV